MKRVSETEDRNLDLLNVFRCELAKAEYPFLLTDVLQNTVSHPARRFYISARRAKEMILDIRAGKDVTMSSNKKKMIDEIMQRLEERENESDKPILHLLEQILDEPAPEFYLKPTSAKVILCKEVQRQRLIEQEQIQRRNERIKKRQEKKRILYRK